MTLEFVCFDVGETLLAKPDSKFFNYALAECDVDLGSVLMVGYSFRLDMRPTLQWLAYSFAR